MPLKRAAVREKLDGRQITQLPDEYLPKAYRILREIEQEHNQHGFAKSSLVRKLEGIGDVVGYEILDYLDRMGYVRVGKRKGGRLSRLPTEVEIREEGREELLLLDELLNPPDILKKDSIRLNVKGARNCAAEISIGSQTSTATDLERIPVLLSSEVLDASIRTIQSLISCMESNFTLTIRAHIPSISGSRIMCLIWEMVKYFERAKRIALDKASSEKVARPQDYRSRYGLLSPMDLSDRVLYRRFFELKFKDWGANTVSHLDLPDSFVSLLKDPKVRSWVADRLDDDPNFFMPHSCWVQLGFPGGANSFQEIEVTPPTLDRLMSYPSLEAKIVGLAKLLEFVIGIQERNKLFWKLGPEDAQLLRDRLETGRGWSDLQEAYNTLHNGILTFDSEPPKFYEGFDLDPQFYECWTVLRRVSRYKSAIPFLYTILDEAYAKYFLNGKKPAVDLAKVFADLAHNRCDLSGAIEQIRKGHYKIEPGKKDRYDPL